MLLYPYTSLTDLDLDLASLFISQTEKQSFDEMMGCPCVYYVSSVNVALEASKASNLLLTGLHANSIGHHVTRQSTDVI